MDMGICKTKGFIGGMGGAGAASLLIITLVLYPGQTSLAEELSELEIMVAQEKVKTAILEDNIQDIRDELHVIDEKQDKMLIILCKDSDSSVCN